MIKYGLLLDSTSTPKNFFADSILTNESDTGPVVTHAVRSELFGNKENLEGEDWKVVRETPCYIVNERKSEPEISQYHKIITLNHFSLKSGFIVDFSHLSVQLTAVSNNEAVVNERLGVGGAQITTCLLQMMIENKRKMATKLDVTYNPDDANNSIKEAHAEVLLNFKESFPVNITNSSANLG
jgi:hypothetical protein